LALFLYLLHERTQVLVTFQHYHVTQRLVVHNRVGNKTKSVRPRPRPRLVWDRSCHKTARSQTSRLLSIVARQANKEENLKKKHKTQW